MVIHQGDLYWVDVGKPAGSSPGYKHPHVFIQNNVFNQSRINTVMICVLTSNLKQANAPGNVLLNAKEAHLPKRSVVVVSQVFTVDKLQLGELIGRLSVHRVRQILDGIKLLTEPRDVE